MKISAHVVLKNEVRFSWFSIMSVLKYVDMIYVVDLGSDDGTIEIIEDIVKSNKNVYFRKLNVEIFDEEKIRGEMLENDESDWIIILDADEIWWDDSIKKVIDTIRSKGKLLDSIFVPTFNVVGDLFHYQEKEAGRYNLSGRTGHYNLRAINRSISGLSAHGEHGVFSWVDEKGIKIEDRNRNKIQFVDAPYIHATHLKRSGKLAYKRLRKLKYEIGIPFPKDFYYPEVFFRRRPSIVPSPWKTPSLSFWLRAFIETPLKKLYRRTFLQFKKHGY